MSALSSPVYTVCSWFSIQYIVVDHECSLASSVTAQCVRWLPLRRGAHPHVRLPALHLLLRLCLLPGPLLRLGRPRVRGDGLAPQEVRRGGRGVKGVRGKF